MPRIAKQSPTDIATLVAQLDALKAQIAGATQAVVAKPKPKAAIPKYATVARGMIVGTDGRNTPCLVFTDENGRETRMGARKIAAVMTFTAECAAFLKDAQ